MFSEAAGKHHGMSVALHFHPVEEAHAEKRDAQAMLEDYALHAGDLDFSEPHAVDNRAR